MIIVIIIILYEYATETQNLFTRLNYHWIKPDVCVNSIKHYRLLTIDFLSRSHINSRPTGISSEEFWVVVVFICCKQGPT